MPAAEKAPQPKKPIESKKPSNAPAVTKAPAAAVADTKKKQADTPSKHKATAAPAPAPAAVVDEVSDEEEGEEVEDDEDWDDEEADEDWDGEEGDEDGEEDEEDDDEDELDEDDDDEDEEDDVAVTKKGSVAKPSNPNATKPRLAPRAAPPTAAEKAAAAAAAVVAAQKAEDAAAAAAADTPPTEAELSSARILSRDDLLAYVLALKPATRDEATGEIQRTTVGMVGYPNVGKSSTINLLCGEKRVTVSSTPGKTKRFQTLLIGDHIRLVDCPGLVFPTFLTSKAEMVVNGLLPIDQLRDHVPPVDLVCRRIPRTLLEHVYGVGLPAPADHEDPHRPPNSHELLEAYAYIRGFMTAHGSPDESRAARLVLKDYVNGKLLYCHAPPAVGATDADELQRETDFQGNMLMHADAKAAEEKQLLAVKRTKPTIRIESIIEASFKVQDKVTAQRIQPGTKKRNGVQTGAAFVRPPRPYQLIEPVRPESKAPATVKPVVLKAVGKAAAATSAAPASAPAPTPTPAPARATAGKGEDDEEDTGPRRDTSSLFSVAPKKQT